MTYRWTPEGPAFDFPSPYGAQNRLLVARGALLLVCAGAIVMAALLLGGGDGARPAFQLDAVAEPPGIALAVWAALLLALLAGADWLQARRQRTLVLVPGQPASLMQEVSREGTGQSPGAAALLRLLAGTPAGKPEPASAASAVSADAVWGDWRAGGAWVAAAARLLHRGADLAIAPDSLHAYLRQRAAHGVLGLGLLVLLLPLMLLTLDPSLAGLVNRRAGAALAALLLCSVAAAAVVVWPLLRSRPSEPGPRAVLLALLAAAMLGAAALWLSAWIPRADTLQRLGLPGAAALLLGGGVLIEWLGLLAVRAQLQPLKLGAAKGETLELGAHADTDPLMREVDLELHRHWSEGIPNRRYAWQTPRPARAAADGTVSGLLLEESQPLSASIALSAAAHGVAAPGVARPALLSWLALLASGAGGLLWLVQIVQQMRGAAAFVEPAVAGVAGVAGVTGTAVVSATWLAASLGLACLLLGVHAMRVAQLLWSRVELQSTLTCLEFQGRLMQTGAAAEGSNGASTGAPAGAFAGVSTGAFTGASAGPQAGSMAGVGAAAAAEADAAAPLASLRLRARVVQLRSVLYAAAAHRVGSRGLLALQDDPAAAAGWTALLATRSRGANALSTLPTPPTATASTTTQPRATARATMPRPAPAKASMPRTASAAAQAPHAAIAAATSTPTAPQRRVQFCPACGTAVDAGARYCQHCGNSLPAG